MTPVNQLRIIDPQQRLKIYDLDETVGVTTLGQEPGSDIVLKGPREAPFQLILDYQELPCRLIVSSAAGPVTVNGEAVPPGSHCEIHDRDVIQVAGYSIEFRTSVEEPVTPDEPPPAPPQPEPIPPAPPDEPEVPEPDSEEPSILTSISERACTIDAGQSVTLQLTVINAGDLVASFDVTVEGIPPEWVVVSPAELHLNEREQASVEVTISPPRLPTSRAGTHHLLLVATSPIYPNERGEKSATLTINPYYELAVGNLSPRRQVISWSKPAGQSEVPLANQGNSDVWVQLAAEDDAHACRFEFEVPDETDEALYLTRQVSLRIPLSETLRLPVRLIPLSRPLVGPGGRLVDLRPRVYPYTITVTMAQREPRSWTLTGEWENSPRFSRRALSLSAVAVALLLLLLTCAIFNPRILSHSVSSASIRAGQVVELDWKAWPPFLISFKLDGRSVSAPLLDRPKQTTTYELRAETWLSHLWPALADTELETVEVRPVKPDILLFEALPQRVMPGQRVILSWVVDDADQLVLIDHGAGHQETLDTPCGSREILVGSDPVHYTLQAIPADGAVVERAVAVQVAGPVIQVFSVDPPAIKSTTDVELSWLVLGAADVITLSRRSFDRSSGQFVVTASTVTPSEDSWKETVGSTTDFSLAVRSSATQVIETARVKIVKPTPTPTQAPALAPAQTPAPATVPGGITVYTALSAEELASFSLPENAVIVRRSTEELVRQLLAEKENPQADVIWGLAATGMIRLRAEGLLEPLDGLYQPEGLENIKAGWLDPTPPPQWLGLSAWPAVFCVNEDRLPVVDGQPSVPRSWAALEHSRYEGLIVMPNPHSSGTGYMVLSGLLQMGPFGEPAGWAYLDRLHENIAWYTSSGREPCSLAAEGSIAIGISAASRCPSEEASAEPATHYVFPEEGYGWEMDAVALGRKDQISRDALAFVAWAISEAAMQEYAQFRPVVSYTGLEPDPACFEEFDEDRMIHNRFLWASSNYERITQAWLSRYGSEPDLIQLESGR